MKAGFIFILLFWFTVANAQHKKVSVLFIGNSYVAVNNLPLLLDSIVVAGGDTMEWDVSAIGSYTLQLHSTNQSTIGKINSRPWDYVILQEQSQLPSFDSASVDSTTIPYALLLDSLIHANNSCTQTVFYETWGRKYGDASNCAFYPPVCTYDGMQRRLMESYKLMADTCHGIVAPVGEAFRYCIAYDSTVNLYQSDESHPSLEGTFLAASVFYNVFFHRSAGGNTYDPGVTQLPVSTFHQLARQIVADSLNFWNLGIYEPWAEFTWDEVPGCNAEFTGSSNSYFSHLWDFGDSTTSTIPNPVHHYQHSHYFPVMHVVSNSCSSDTFMLTNNMICNDAVGEIIGEPIEVFPNPADQFLIVRNLDSGSGLTIYNLLGEKVFEKRSSESLNQIPVSGLTDGIYFLVITSREKTYSAVRFAVRR